MDIKDQKRDMGWVSLKLITIGGIIIVLILVLVALFLI